MGIFQIVGMLLAWTIRAIWEVNLIEQFSVGSWLIGVGVWLLWFFDEWKKDRACKAEVRKRRKRMPRFLGENV